MNCDNCNSEVITVMRNGKQIAECSYCGSIIEEDLISFDKIIEFENVNE